MNYLAHLPRVDPAIGFPNFTGWCIDGWDMFWTMPGSMLVAFDNLVSSFYEQEPGSSGASARASAPAARASPVDTPVARMSMSSSSSAASPLSTATRTTSFSRTRLRTDLPRYYLDQRRGGAWQHFVSVSVKAPYPVVTVYDARRRTGRSAMSDVRCGELYGAAVRFGPRISSAVYEKFAYCVAITVLGRWDTELVDVDSEHDWSAHDHVLSSMEEAAVHGSAAADAVSAAAQENGVVVGRALATMAAASHEYPGGGGDRTVLVQLAGLITAGVVPTLGEVAEVAASYALDLSSTVTGGYGGYGGYAGYGGYGGYGGYVGYGGYGGGYGRDVDVVEMLQKLDDHILDAPTADGDGCAICLADSFESGESVRIFSRDRGMCGHRFHADCIEACLRRSGSRCPLCRFDLAVVRPTAGAAPAPPRTAAPGAHLPLFPGPMHV